MSDIKVTKDFIYVGQKIDANIEDGSVYFSDTGLLLSQNGVTYAYGKFDPSTSFTSKAIVGSDIGSLVQLKTSRYITDLGCFYVPEFTARSLDVAADSLIEVPISINTMGVNQASMKSLITFASTDIDGTTGHINCIYGADPVFTISNTYQTSLFFYGNDLLNSNRWYLQNGKMRYFFDIIKVPLEVGKDGSAYKLFYTYVNLTNYGGVNFKQGYELVGNTITHNVQSLTENSLIVYDASEAIGTQAIGYSAPFAVRDVSMHITNDNYASTYLANSRGLTIYVGDNPLNKET